VKERDSFCYDHGILSVEMIADLDVMRSMPLSVTPGFLSTVALMKMHNWFWSRKKVADNTVRRKFPEWSMAEI
jgi:hypothetical protein